MSEASLRAEMCDVGRCLWERKLVGAAEGNLSVRLGEGSLLCTPAGIPKELLRPDDLLIIDHQGKPVDGGTPSSEIKLHLRIYDRRPDCQAVVHAHPITATAFSVAGKEIPSDLLPEAAYVLGRVATVPFAVPGTEDVPDAIEPFLSDHKTFLLSHHGAVTLGKTLTDACQRMETLERIAELLLRAEMLGGSKPLPEAGRLVIESWISPLL
ncbi:MAG: class II aldolase/adducin family protein [Fimbriimonadaceae bacterium]